MQIVPIPLKTKARCNWVLAASLSSLKGVIKNNIFLTYVISGCQLGFDKETELPFEILHSF